MIQDTIDGVLIESDEDGFHLILSGGRAEYDFRIQGVAVELLKAVQREIGPWYAEGEAVLAEMMARQKAHLYGGISPLETGRAFACDPDESAGAYDISDPKHPDHHSVHADIWDLREGK